MEIKLAKSAGFCFGVRRAVEFTEEACEAGGEVFTFGPIVHNETVIQEFAEKRVTVTEDLDFLREKTGTLVIRAHGIRRDQEEALRDSGLTLVDATCPFVKRIHRIAEEESGKGRLLVILGDPDHPEVKGILGWCRGPAVVIRDEEDPILKELPENQPISVVSQTTFDYEKFKKIVAIIKLLSYDVNVATTVCSATKERQEEARDIASAVDVMLVIGSPSSSNSQKLYSICKARCSHTYFIQSGSDLKDSWFQSVKCVGITAGASTPNNIIEEVQKHVGEF